MKKCVYLLVLLLCSVSGGAQGKAEQQSVRLILNWKPESEFGGFYSAELDGHYKKNRLKVDILPGGIGTPSVQMVASGKAEFGIGSADEVLLSHSRGSDVIAVFAVYQRNPQTILVREDHPGKTLEAVLSQGSLAGQKGLAYFTFLEKKFGPIQAKVVPTMGGISQLASDSTMAVQGFATAEPIIARSRGLKVRVFEVADAGFDPYTTVVITRARFAQKHPQVVRDFAEAVRLGWEGYLKNPKPANEVMHKLNPAMTLPILEQSAKEQVPYIQTAFTRKHGLGAMSLERWKTLSQQLVDIGLLKTPVDPPKVVWQSRP